MASSQDDLLSKAAAWHQSRRTAATPRRSRPPGGKIIDDATSARRAPPVSTATRVLEPAERARQDMARHFSGAPMVVGKHAIATPCPHEDHVAVSVSAWRTPDRLVARAVASVLRGKHRNVHVVLVQDGDERPVELPGDLQDDPRLVHVRSPWNMRPYFNHDAVLRALGAQSLFAIQDSDDESHPARLATQISAMVHARADACYTPVTNVSVDGSRTKVGSTLRGLSDRFCHRADQFGVWSGASLMRLGGYYAGFRVGFDSVITSTVALLGRVSTLHAPLYTRYRRAESLTRSAETGHRSAFRRAEKAKLSAFYADVCSHARTSTAAGIARHCALATERAAPHAGRTAELVSMIRERAEARPWAAPVSRALLDRTIDAAPASDWAISRTLARHLYATCQARGFRNIVDVGSGMSTLVLALYASRTPGVRVLSLEHDRDWYAKTKAALHQAGLSDHVDLRLLPLRRRSTPRAHVWYEGAAELVTAPVDFMLVDGPPRDEATRHGALWRISPDLLHGATVWLHDGARDEERAVVRDWQAHMPMSATLRTSEDHRGVFEIEVA